MDLNPLASPFSHAHAGAIIHAAHNHTFRRFLVDT
jgi:hypothetical protein